VRILLTTCHSVERLHNWQWIEPMKLTLEVLERLVGFDTVSGKPNVEIIAFIQNFLETRGARCTPLPSKQTGKLGLYAEIGPQSSGGILLSGHTDVVSVKGQDWTQNPFSLTHKSDRLYGRGTTDMKGYVACMLRSADIASRRQMKEPLKLVFSYDEEIGCVGIQEMMGSLPQIIGTPRACFVGEPTEMQVATGHKGKVELEAVCFGQAGHSALAPNFVSALHIAADLITGLKDMQRWFVDYGAQDVAYDISYNTLHVGKMWGGAALNMIPERAMMTLEYRHLAEDAPALIMDRLRVMSEEILLPYRAIFADSKIEINQINAYPGLDVSASSDASKLAQKLLEVKKTTKVTFGTEAGFFDELGIPTVVCGPGSMARQGHKADEYINHSQLISCNRMLAGIIEELSA
jgi:acetylornithine deacetylase